MKISNDTIENRTRDLPGFRAVPQQNCATACPGKIYIFILKRPANILGSVNVILLQSNHRHVSATRVATFRVVITRTEVK